MTPQAAALWADLDFFADMLRIGEVCKERYDRINYNILLAVAKELELPWTEEQLELAWLAFEETMFERGHKPLSLH